MLDFGGFDSNHDGVINNTDRYVTFDDKGNPVGITLRDGLAAAGFTQYDEKQTPTSTLTQAQIDHSYSVVRVSDGKGGTVERIWRIRRTALQAGKANEWDIITSTGVDRSLGLDDYILRPGTDITIGFVQDLDQDGMIGLVESVNSCSDTTVDSDGDGLDDRFEVLVGWAVSTERGSSQVHSRCSSKDTDGDGLPDFQEAPGRIQRDNRGLILFGPGQAPTRDTSGVSAPPTPTPAQTLLAYQVDLAVHDPITDPTSSDTDGDGLTDVAEIVPYRVNLLPRNPNNFVFLTTSPEHFDSDGDTASDGIEFRIGGNARNPGDRNLFADDDGDGLVNVQETTGRQIKVTGASVSPRTCNAVCNQGPIVIRTVTSDPNKADTDGDGLSDKEEFALGSDPRSRDTDADGLTDFEEVRGFTLRDLGSITTSPTDADTDNDKRSDGAEADRSDSITVRVPGATPYRAFSNPTTPDGDLDRLVDGEEAANGTDPAKSNTDGDNLSDYQEVVGGRRPLVPDLNVTVTFANLVITEDSDRGDPGDFEFNLGVRKPDGSFTLAADGKSDYGLPACAGAIKSLCRESSGHIAVNSGERLKLGHSSGRPREVNLGGVSTSKDKPEDFSVAGFLTEFDEGRPSCEATFPDLFATPANAADPPSSTVAGVDLETGQHGISFGQEVACKISTKQGPMKFTVQVSYTAR